MARFGENCDAIFGPRCLRCRVKLEPGIAMVSTLVRSRDFGEIITLNPGGPGRMVKCMKCPKCGYSVTTTTP
jgi:hypothetical protein